MKKCKIPDCHFETSNFDGLCDGCWEVVVRMKSASPGLIQGWLNEAIDAEYSFQRKEKQ